MTALSDTQVSADTAERAESSTGTLDFLLRRMRHKSDFPALSSTISAINEATASEDESADVLCSTILKDFALTTKLLKMVNTAYFGAFGGTISTVSKAVVILGYDRVRTAAITLVLFEHLQNKAEAKRLRDDIIASYFSGILARQLVGKAGIRNAEEAFICASFHNLGRLLTSFYLSEESREIEKLKEQKGIHEMQASLQVLGLSYEELGLGAAKAWNFPLRVVQSMRHVSEGKVKRPVNDEEKLRMVSDFSTSVCDAMRESDDQKREKKLDELVGKFGEALSVNAQMLASSIKQSAQELAKDAVVLELKIEGSAFVASTATAGDRAAAAEEAAELHNLISRGTVDALSDGGDERSESDPKRKAMLFDGIQEITTRLMGEFKLNDVLRKILETMYRSAGFTRVLLYVRDTGSNSLVSRFGLGADVDKIISAKFSIPLASSKDVFQAAVANGADVYIENVNAEAIRKHIPDAYRKVIPARSFALFPIVVKGKPIGLFYGDSDIEGAVRFTSEELSLLKTLRNQAVLAIKQTA